MNSWILYELHSKLQHPAIKILLLNYEKKEEKLDDSEGRQQDASIEFYPLLIRLPTEYSMTGTCSSFTSYLMLLQYKP